MHVHHVATQIRSYWLPILMPEGETPGRPFAQVDFFQGGEKVGWGGRKSKEFLWNNTAPAPVRRRRKKRNRMQVKKKKKKRGKKKTAAAATKGGNYGRANLPGWERWYHPKQKWISINKCTCDVI